MTLGYDASARTVLPVDAIGQRTNMTYDPGPHPTPVAASPPLTAGANDAAGPILWVIDPLGNRVELTPPTPTPPPDAEGDEPIVINRSE
jgi:hypothetical protein